MIERAGDNRRVSPVVARRQLNKWFVRARRNAGFASRDAAAEALGWSPRKQALLESDDQPIPLRDLDVILPALRVPVDAWPAWRRLAELSRAKGWWDTYDKADLPREGKRYIGLEWGARRIRTFDGSIMPALLQIPAYTTAALEAGIDGRAPEAIERLLGVRRMRQRILAEPDPVDFHAILDEAALRRPGADARTMRAQVDHLIDLASLRPSLTLQVVPFTAGLYAGLSGNFVIMDYEDQGDGDSSIVHSEPGFARPVYAEERADRYLYSRLFQRLGEIALSPADSLAMLRSVARDLHASAKS